MKHKILIHMRGIISFLLILFMIVQGADSVAQAAEKGEVYIASAHAYYRHPVTGIVEDPGNNEGIGQGMSDKMLNDEALIEKTEDGELYVTLRLYLTQYISEVNYWTQERNTDSWSEASHQVIQENLGGEYCTDYRLKLPAEDGIIKCSFFVEPMGRAIIFFMDFSDWTAGSGDFVVSVDTSGQEITAKGSVKEGSAKEGSADNKNSKNNVAVTGKEVTKDIATTENNSLATSAAVSDPNPASATDVYSNAADLIASAKGLVVSDETLLTKDLIVSVETPLTQEETALTLSDESNDLSLEENIMLSLSWTLVWQCILIITLPGIIIGSCLYLLMFLTGRKEGKR